MRFAAPSPRGSNKAGLVINVRPGPVDWRKLALDQSNGSREQLQRAIRERADRASDLTDPAQLRETGEDQEEVTGLLEQLDRGASGEQRPGASALDQRIANLAHFLKGKGLRGDDIRTACDLMRRAHGASGDDLGIGKSAVRGGAFGGNFGGNLHSEVDQPRTRPTDPASRDQATCYEEDAGHEPLRPRGRDSRRVGRDDFGMLFGMLPTLEEAQRARRRSPTAKEIAMDSAAHDLFERMFPEAARIRNYI
jgi:hypothetical protein